METGKRPGSDRDAVVEQGYCDGVVEEDEFLVGVIGGDGEVEFGVEGVRSVVELGDLEGGDGEGGALGSVEEPDDGGGDGGEEEDEEDEESGP